MPGKRKARKKTPPAAGHVASAPSGPTFEWWMVVPLPLLGTAYELAGTVNIWFTYAFGLASWILTMQMARRLAGPHSGFLSLRPLAFAALLTGLHWAVINDVNQKIEERALSEPEGILVPGNEPSPHDNPCAHRAKPSDIVIGTGLNASIPDRFPFIALATTLTGSSRAVPLVTIERDANGLLHPILRVVTRDNDHVIVAMGSENFRVNKNNILTMSRPARNRLIVRDQHDKIALDIHYRNPNFIKISGDFLDDPQHTGYNVISGICSIGQGIPLTIVNPRRGNSYNLFDPLE